MRTQVDPFTRTRPLLLTLALRAGLGILSGAQAQGSASAPAQVVRLETAELAAVWVYPERTAPAQVLPRNESRLAAEVSGTLRRWTADVGAAVKRGELSQELITRHMATRRSSKPQRADAGPTHPHTKRNANTAAKL